MKRAKSTRKQQLYVKEVSIGIDICRYCDVDKGIDQSEKLFPS